MRCTGGACAGRIVGKGEMRAVDVASGCRSSEEIAMPAELVPHAAIPELAARVSPELLEVLRRIQKAEFIMNGGDIDAKTVEALGRLTVRSRLYASRCAQISLRTISGLLQRKTSIFITDLTERMSTPADHRRPRRPLHRGAATALPPPVPGGQAASSDGRVRLVERRPQSSRRGGTNGDAGGTGFAILWSSRCPRYGLSASGHKPSTAHDLTNRCSLRTLHSKF